MSVQIQAFGDVYFEIPHGEGTVKATTDCEVFPTAIVCVEMTKEQALRILNRQGNIQDILPDVGKELREIFTGSCTGMTPAEWDERMVGKVRHWRWYANWYGYKFDHEAAEPDWMDQVDAKNGKKLEWVRQAGASGGTCGAVWRHTTGATVQHCGHPTALYPYQAWKADGSPVAIECDGKHYDKFALLKDAKEQTLKP